MPRGRRRGGQKGRDRRRGHRDLWAAELLEAERPGQQPSTTPVFLPPGLELARDLRPRLAHRARLERARQRRRGRRAGSKGRRPAASVGRLRPVFVPPALAQHSGRGALSARRRAHNAAAARAGAGAGVYRPWAACSGRARVRGRRGGGGGGGGALLGREGRRRRRGSRRVACVGRRGLEGESRRESRPGKVVRAHLAARRQGPHPATRVERARPRGLGAGRERVRSGEAGRPWRKRRRRRSAPQAAEPPP
mmetsp:Transcript_33599/g.75974  ORF Transcript_33599/g.75974 Transcript_33599/m.75974 type:complete len:251 (-) Transcript_33599:69-821(-)